MSVDGARLRYTGSGSTGLMDQPVSRALMTGKKMSQKCTSRPAAGTRLP
jgi:hypothetical protein